MILFCHPITDVKDHDDLLRDNIQVPREPYHPFRVGDIDDENTVQETIYWSMV